MANRYDNNYSDIGHAGMLWLKDVPEFEYVYMHIGNSHENTEGCLLVNYTAYLDPANGGGSGGRSVAAYKDLYKKIYPVLEMGEQVFITIKDEGVR